MAVDLVHVVTSVPGGQTKGLTGEARYKLLREGRIALTNVRKIADAFFGIYEKRVNDPPSTWAQDPLHGAGHEGWRIRAI